MRLGLLVQVSVAPAVLSRLLLHFYYQSAQNFRSTHQLGGIISRKNQKSSAIHLQLVEVLGFLQKELILTCHIHQLNGRPQLPELNEFHNAHEYS